MGIRKFFKKQFNTSDWLGTEQLKSSMSTVKGIYKDTFKGGKEEVFKGETFKEYVSHYQITPEEIENRKNMSHRFVYVYGGCGLGLLLYMFYQFFAAHILGGFMCLVLALLFFAYGLKEQFRYIQFKQKKLKVNFKECFKEFIKRD